MCQGKKNGVNILKSIDEGPFQMGTFQETLAEGDEGALHLGLDDHVSILTCHLKIRKDAKDIWDNVKMILEGSELTKKDHESQLYDDFEHFHQRKGENIHDYYVRFAKLVNDMRNIKMTMSRMQLNSKFVNNMLPEWGRFVTAVKLNRGAAGYGGAQNRVGNVNPGQVRQIKCYNCNVDDCDAFDSDVDEAPTAQTIFMANLSSVNPVYDEAGLSYVLDTLSEIHDHDHYQDAVCEHHEEHEMHDDCVKDNAVPVVQSNVSSIPNDAYIMILNEMHEQPAQYVSGTIQNTVVDKSLTAELATYKEQPYYDEQNKVAIGYKNPLCLTPALYNGHEIIKTNHVPAIVHNTEDTLEIAEMTRKKINDKMKDPECVNHKVKIAPLDYSEGNYLATFTPQKQLILEQIFWSQDLIKMKAEALKKLTTSLRPIKALTVYPPNTPATLVPMILPTKSQVKINIFTLIQLFSEFEKTCKKRIITTGLTKEERGFEQTKECYLTKVNPFFKTLKEHFKGIQKALTKEIKEMKDIFDELEAEVDQNAVNRKHDEIEWKNILIAHDNLIADCLSKDVLYIAMNYELTVSRFTEMHDAHTIVQARCLELEAELSNLCDKWRPTGRTFTLGEQCPLTRLTEPKVVPAKQTEHVSTSKSVITKKLGHTSQKPLTRYQRKNQPYQAVPVSIPTSPKNQIVLWYLDSGCSKHMTGDRSRLMNFMKKFIGTVRFGNEYFGAIMGYGDYVIGDSVISKHSCFVRDMDGVESIKGSHDPNLYTISVEDMIKSSLICLLSKASENKSWLWHRRLNHLKFDTINDLARKDLVIGLPRLKFKKDHLCSACQLGKSKKHPHKPKTKNTNLEVLHTLHIDLCGPMRVQIINGKKYILVIVDDYSRFTWVKFLRSKDETPDVIKFLKQIQVDLNKTVRNIRTDNGTKFVNKDLTDYYERVGIFLPKDSFEDSTAERRC
ncbi:integrase, catalytic region, zinc finger, CCHC-type containing protein [Tanacetum coccineum]